MRKNRRNGLNKEQIIMLSASGFVIMALTLTGIYVSQKNRTGEDDGYHIDLSSLEERESEEDVKPQVESPTNIVSSGTAEQEKDQVDMDVDPSFLEEGNEPEIYPWSSTENMPVDVLPEVETEPVKTEEVINTEVVKEDAITVDKLNFGSVNTLKWPVVGNILLNYSMDKTIYFPTLDVYKYNPAVIIESQEGAAVIAPADAVVEEIFFHEEYGNTVRMNLGDGYEILCGQLTDVTAQKGDGIRAGEILGYAASPTKYYAMEGCNIYLKLQKDGTPLNPLSILE